MIIQTRHSGNLIWKMKICKISSDWWTKQHTGYADTGCADFLPNTKDVKLNLTLKFWRKGLLLCQNPGEVMIGVIKRTEDTEKEDLLIRLMEKEN